MIVAVGQPVARDDGFLRAMAQDAAAPSLCAAAAQTDSEGFCGQQILQFVDDDKRFIDKRKGGIRWRQRAARFSQSCAKLFQLLFCVITHGRPLLLYSVDDDW